MAIELILMQLHDFSNKRAAQIYRCNVGGIEDMQQTASWQAVRSNGAQANRK